MISRETVVLPQRPRISMRSTARFFHLVDAIARAHEPSATQLAALERSYTSTGEFLAACPEFRGILTEIHAHGSRQLGTIVRPRDGSREGFDIDLIARLLPDARRKYEGEKGPALLLDHLHAALSRYADTHGLLLHRWERCATLEYAEGMRADIAPVIDAPLLASQFGETHGLIPDQRTSASSTPQIHAGTPSILTSRLQSLQTLVRHCGSQRQWDVQRSIAGCNSVAQCRGDIFDRSSCVALFNSLKLHRNIAFGAAQVGEDMAPSSVFLTTLAAMACYTVEAPPL